MDIPIESIPGWVAIIFLAFDKIGLPILNRTIGPIFSRAKASDKNSQEVRLLEARGLQEALQFQFESERLRNKDTTNAMNSMAEGLKEMAVTFMTGMGVVSADLKEVSLLLEKSLAAQVSHAEITREMIGGLDRYKVGGRAMMGEVTDIKKEVVEPTSVSTPFEEKIIAKGTKNKKKKK